MPIKIEVEAGHQPFTYSAVGLETKDGGHLLVNTFGFVASGCQEYARRYAARSFKAMFPTAELTMVSAMLIDPENFHAEPI